MAVLRRLLLVVPGLFLLLCSPRAEATVEMQNRAKKLGFTVKNCLYCHASSHAAETMHAKAKALNIPEGDCLACHGGSIPVTLNDRGRWLVAQKRAQGAQACDMAWLKDYKEPTPAPKPAPTPTPKDLITVQPHR